MGQQTSRTAACLLALAVASSVSRALVLDLDHGRRQHERLVRGQCRSVQFAQDGPAGGLIDRDAPVGSTGRDLTAFSWTWDSTYLFFYVARAAAAYALTASGGGSTWISTKTERCRRPSTWSACRGREAIARPTTTLYQYVPVSSAGDSLGDAAGFADGWDMPGSATSILTIESGFGGAARRRRDGGAHRVVAPRRPVGNAGQVSRLGVEQHEPPERHPRQHGGAGERSAGCDRSGSGWTRTARRPPRRPATWSSRTRPPTSDPPGTRSTSPGPASGGFAPASLAFYRDANANGLLDAGDPALTDTDGGHAARLRERSPPVARRECSSTSRCPGTARGADGFDHGDRVLVEGPCLHRPGDRHRHDRHARAHAPQVGRQSRGPSGRDAQLHDPVPRGGEHAVVRREDHRPDSTPTSPTSRGRPPAPE